MSKNLYVKSKVSKIVSAFTHSAKVATAVTTISAMLAVTFPSEAFAKNWVENVMSETLKGSMSNASGGKAFSTGTRNVLSGGSVAVKNKIFSDNLLSFSPPSFKAGCGGLDFFAGSFSFINADQLVQLFRAVMANSIGAMFDLALRQVSPDLAAIMQKFSDMIREINMMLSDSCELAKGIAVDIAGATGLVENPSEKDGFLSKVKESKTRIATAATGLVDDIGAKMGKIFGSSDSGSTEKMATGDPSTLAELKNQGLVGNLIWNTLQAKSTRGEFAQRMLGSFRSGDNINETIMSVTGTVLAVPPNSSLNATNNTSDKLNYEYRAPILGLEGFMLGSESASGYKLYKCKDGDQCLKLEVEELPNVKGYAQTLYYQLCGAESLADECKTDSAVGRLANNSEGTGRGINDQQANSLALLPPLVRLKLAELQIKSGAANRSGGCSAGGTFLKEYIKPIALNVSYDFSNEIMAALNSHIQGVEGDAANKEVGQKISEAAHKLNQEYEALCKKYGTTDTVVAELDRLLKNYESIPTASAVSLRIKIGNGSTGNK